MSDTDPYADPAAPSVYNPPAKVLKASEEDAVEAAEDVATPVEDPAAPEVEEAVPEGTAAEVVAWVGDDAERAARALEAEEAGQKRKTLIKTLKAVL